MGYGGNGGLSLRTKNIMINCLKYPPPKGTRFDKQPEDLYFCNTNLHISLFVTSSYLPNFFC
jgi:hypothetical protein